MLHARSSWSCTLSSFDPDAMSSVRGSSSRSPHFACHVGQFGASGCKPSRVWRRGRRGHRGLKGVQVRVL
jgi:hypothetical protein